MAPLLHKKVYVGVPPVTVIEIAPSAPPLHVTLSTTELLIVGNEPEDTIPTDCRVQPLASVTVTVYEFAVRPVIVVVEAPLLHK